jgi:hypothetical protein
MPDMPRFLLVPMSYVVFLFVCGCGVFVLACGVGPHYHVLYDEKISSIVPRGEP